MSEKAERAGLLKEEKRNITNDFRVIVWTGQREIQNERLKLCASGCVRGSVIFFVCYAFFVYVLEVLL